MPRNPLMDALMRLQPSANRMDFPDGSGFDNDLAIKGMLDQPTLPISQLRSPSGPTGSRRIAMPWTNLQVSPGLSRTNPQAAVDDFNMQLQNETEERLFNAMRTGSRDVSALKEFLGNVNKDLATSPMQMEIDANQRARLAGFPSSAAAGEYARGLETAKVMSPLQEAQATAQGRVQEAGIKGQADVRGKEVTAKGGVDKQRLIEGTKTQGFDALGKMFGGPGDGRSRSMSVPGVGAFSIGAERPDAVTPTALQTNLMNARRQFARTQSPQDKIAVDQAIANVIQSSPSSDTTKQWAHEIAANPRLSAMPLDEIVRLHESKTGDALEYEEIVELRNLMSQVLAGINDPK